MFINANKEKEGKIKLLGFNNLTKVLSFNLYDFCITLGDEQKSDYINFISQKYNSGRIVDISSHICQMIDANILDVSKQDYDPVGASAMVLMSDVSMHLDKSHITTHTYPDAADPCGICSFRVDIDIATCGNIVPLSAINYLFRAFECDVVVIDYVVRGYTRLENGSKIYNDHKFNSIQDFIDPKILSDFHYRSDMNLENANTWQTKLMIKNFGPERYLYEPSEINHPDIDHKMRMLHEEMKEVFHLMN